jgi:hypothetical protein
MKLTVPVFSSHSAATHSFSPAAARFAMNSIAVDLTVVV